MAGVQPWGDSKGGERAEGASDAVKSSLEETTNGDESAPSAAYRPLSGAPDSHLAVAAALRFLHHSLPLACFQGVFAGRLVSALWANVVQPEPKS